MPAIAGERERARERWSTFLARILWMRHGEWQQSGASWQGRREQGRQAGPSSRQAKQAGGSAFRQPKLAGKMFARAT